MTDYLPRNIVVEDKRPTLQAFMIYMEGVEPWSNPEKRRDPGDLFGIVFQGYCDWKCALLLSNFLGFLDVAIMS